jgi:predicted outer membrane repeat protein
VTLEVDSALFAWFDAQEGGGIASDGTVFVSGSTFSGNSSAERGGGISYGGRYNSSLTVSNSTFIGNSAGSEGGGVYSSTSDGVTVSNSTLTGNSAGQQGGGVYSALGFLTLKNTIVANSPGGNNCSGAITDGGGNLSYPDTTCPGINLNPRLYPLQDNGGPTMTMALGPGSGALDAGNDAVCAAPPVNYLDQRGHVRPKGSGCDIGAVEQDPYPTTWFPLALRR